MLGGGGGGGGDALQTQQPRCLSAEVRARFHLFRLRQHRHGHPGSSGILGVQGPACVRGKQAGYFKAPPPTVNLLFRGSAQRPCSFAFTLVLAPSLLNKALISC